MEEAWRPDPRLVRTVSDASGRSITVRLDSVALQIAGEVKDLIERLPEDEPWARFVAGELEVAIAALRLGITNAFTEERFAALIFGRMLVESAIRLSWLLSQGSDEGSVRVCAGRLEKRDLQQLLAASRSIDTSSAFGHILEDPEAIARYVDSIDAPGAPELRQMAEEAGWEWLYGIHRFCSAMLHPGIGSRSHIADIVEPNTYAVLLYLAFSGAAVSGGRAVRSLFPQIDAKLPVNEFVLERRGIIESDEVTGSAP